MNCEELKSTRQILAYVAAHEGEVTWYNIVTKGRELLKRLP